MNSSFILQIPSRQDQDQDQEEDEEEEEEGPYGARLIPRSSPVPRRRSLRGEELGEEVPAGRKVSFADARGLELARVCVFQPFPEPEEEGSPRPAFRLCPAFAQELSAQQLLDRVRRRKVELESVRGVADDPLSVDCRARVLNLAYQKSVQACCTLDEWSSQYHLPAEYVPSPSDGAGDRFAFRLSYPGASAREGARLHFVLRYESPGGVYWANNGGANYTLVCRGTGEGQGVPAPSPVPLRSCLKVTPRRYDEEEVDTGGAEWNSRERTNEDAKPSPPHDWTVQVPELRVMDPGPDGLSHPCSGFWDQPTEGGPPGLKVVALEGEAAEGTPGLKRAAEEEEEGEKGPPSLKGAAAEVEQEAAGPEGEPPVLKVAAEVEEAEKRPPGLKGAAEEEQEEAGPEGEPPALKGAAQEAAEGVPPALKGAAEEQAERWPPGLKGAAEEQAEGEPPVLKGAAQEQAEGWPPVLKEAAQEAAEGEPPVLKGAAEEQAEEGPLGLKGATQEEGKGWPLGLKGAAQEEAEGWPPGLKGATQEEGEGWPPGLKGATQEEGEGWPPGLKGATQEEGEGWPPGLKGATQEEVVPSLRPEARGWRPPGDGKAETGEGEWEGRSARLYAVPGLHVVGACHKEEEEEAGEEGGPDEAYQAAAKPGPDLESLATLGRSLGAALRVTELLVLLAIALSNSGSLIWCTLYLFARLFA